MKKVCSIVLVFLLLLGCQSIVFGAELTDVKGTVYEEAVDALVSAGVVDGYPDGTFRPEAPVSREEAAKLVALATAEGNRIPAAALAEYAKAAAAAFSDVAESDWAAGYIGAGLSAGWLNGYPDGSFGRAREVSCHEAIKMAVAALGLEGKEGTPWYQPYVDAAEANGLLWDGAYTDGDAPAGRGLVAKVCVGAIAAAEAAAAAENEGEQNEGETDQTEPAQSGALDLANYNGRLFGVVQSVSSMQNFDGDTVPSLSILVGRAYKGDLAAKKGYDAATSIGALSANDYLKGQVFAFRVTKGMVREMAVSADNAAWVKQFDELTCGKVNADGFARIDEVNDDGLITLLGDPNAAPAIDKGYVALSDETLVVYLLKEKDDEAYYELGKASDVKDLAYVRLYDVTDDKDESANIVIVDKRD